MKERPIIFNEEMLRALLDGRKTQTRQVIKPQPTIPVSHFRCVGHDVETGRGDWQACDKSGKPVHAFLGIPGCITEIAKCPYGKPGDRLWVRETTIRVEEHGYVGPVYRATENGQAMLTHGLAPEPDDAVEVEPYDLRLRPSVHMPRNMARILLEVVSVRVERLQDISEADAIAEGCDNSETKAAQECGWYEKPRRAFRRVWWRINGFDSWSDNPWVWVVEFRRVNQQQVAA